MPKGKLKKRYSHLKLATVEVLRRLKTEPLKKLQQKLTSYEKDKDKQKLLIKEEEQKKKISQELIKIVSKNYKKDSEGFLQSISDKINMNIVPVINTINQILETNIVDENKKEHLETMKSNLFDRKNIVSITYW